MPCPPSKPRRRRDGAVTVEFALVCPLFFLFVLSAIEFSRANMLVHTSVIAATEGARAGIVAGATADECYAAAQKELVNVGINQASIVVYPDTITDQTDTVTVGVRVPMTLKNTYVTPQFVFGEEIIRTVSVTREAKNIGDINGDANRLNSQAAYDLKNKGGRGAGKLKQKGSTDGGGFFRWLLSLFQ